MVPVAECLDPIEAEYSGLGLVIDELSERAAAVSCQSVGHNRRGVGKAGLVGSDEA